MRRVKLEGLEKGDLVLVRWLDAFEIRCSVGEHNRTPEVYCKDWGGVPRVSGRKHGMLIVGKDVVELHNEWGATRIPLELVVEIVLVMPRKQVLRAIREVQVLGRRMRLRRFRSGEIERALGGDPHHLPGILERSGV